jgi:hypothetical protein
MFIPFILNPEFCSSLTRFLVHVTLDPSAHFLSSSLFTITESCLRLETPPDTESFCHVLRTLYSSDRHIPWIKNNPDRLLNQILTSLSPVGSRRRKNPHVRVVELLEEMSVFDPCEFDSVFCRENVMDVADWKRHCDFMGVFSASRPVIALFFEVLSGWSQKNLNKLLAFTTGSPQVPLGGFGRLERREGQS